MVSFYSALFFVLSVGDVGCFCLFVRLFGGKKKALKELFITTYILVACMSHAVAYLYSQELNSCIKRFWTV